jgi:hypothetical protein
MTFPNPDDPRLAEADRLTRQADGYDTHAEQLRDDANELRLTARRIRVRVAREPQASNPREPRFPQEPCEPRVPSNPREPRVPTPAEIQGESITPLKDRPDVMPCLRPDRNIENLAAVLEHERKRASRALHLFGLPLKPEGMTWAEYVSSEGPLYPAVGGETTEAHREDCTDPLCNCDLPMDTAESVQADAEQPQDAATRTRQYVVTFTSTETGEEWTSKFGPLVTYADADRYGRSVANARGNNADVANVTWRVRDTFEERDLRNPTITYTAVALKAPPTAPGKPSTVLVPLSGREDAFAVAAEFGEVLDRRSYLHVRVPGIADDVAQTISDLAMNESAGSEVTRLWQTCPVCNGHGIVVHGFFAYPAGQPFDSTSTGPDPCRRCEGTGTIIAPPPNTEGTNDG